MQTALRQYRQMTVDHCVEYLCEQGCAKVSGYIEALQSDQRLPELSRLSDYERQAVLDELVEVMSVYQGNCSR
jgi:hypothetical protein